MSPVPCAIEDSFKTKSTCALIVSERSATMYSGLWMFAWDLADEGIDRVMVWAADSGLTALQIAGSYHAGWFIHPHNPKQRAFMTEDGSVYFQPTLKHYEHTAL